MNCKLCGLAVDAKCGIKYQDGFVHKSCFENMLKLTYKNKTSKLKQVTVEKKQTKRRRTVTKSQIEKMDKSLKSALSEEEQQDKEDLRATINRLVAKIEDVDIPLILAKTTALMTKYGFTYRDIRLGLEYYYDRLGHTPTGDIVGVLPYIIRSARKDADMIRNAVQANTEFLEKHKSNGINKYNVTYRKIEKNKKPLFDLSRIGET